MLIKVNCYLTIRTGFDFSFSFQKLSSIGRSYFQLSNYIGFSSPAVILKIQLITTTEHQPQLRRPAVIIVQNDTDFKTVVVSYLFSSHLLILQASSHCNNNGSTILIFQSPKSLLSDSLEQETSMDIKRMVHVVGEIMLSISI